MISHHQQVSQQTMGVRSRRFTSVKKPFLICLVTLLVALVAQQSTVEALWFFQTPASSDPSSNRTLIEQFMSAASSSGAEQQQQQLLQQASQETAVASSGSQGQSKTGSSYSSYGSSLMSIAGIQPSNLASIFNSVGDTGFRYFNIQDQCRNRAACDLGFMLYRKLSFVHNWLIRTSVRSLTDMNNIYTQSWMEGMLGRNCTAVYMACRQSPLEGIMNMAILQHLAF